MLSFSLNLRGVLAINGHNLTGDELKSTLLFLAFALGLFVYAFMQTEFPKLQILF
jgi:hypothetical protein